ncbi:MAG: hypothetical protein GX640_05255, partial [Fibrobacter sp.]|nr:hypothetical protein [Fibrobacter sp.]
MQSGGTATLRAGTYTFNSITIQTDAHVLYDMSIFDVLDIYIRNDIEISDRSSIEFSGSNAYAPAVRLYTNDQNIVRVGTGVKLTGIIIAPYAEVHLCDGVTCDGALYARKVVLESVANISTGTIDPDGDADGDGVPNYSEYNLRTDPKRPDESKTIGIPNHSMIDNSHDETVFYNYNHYHPQLIQLANS